MNPAVNPAITVVVLAVVWAAMTGNFSAPNLLFGLAIGGGVMLLLRRALTTPTALRRLRNVLSLLVLFLYELMVSAVRVARVVLSPNLKAALRPAIIAVPLTVRSDVEIALLANLITLTPGTLSIDVSQDRSVLYVHTISLDTREALIADIAGGFEAKIREIYA